MIGSGNSRPQREMRQSKNPEDWVTRMTKLGRTEGEESQVGSSQRLSGKPGVDVRNWLRVKDLTLNPASACRKSFCDIDLRREPHPFRIASQSL